MPLSTNLNVNPYFDDYDPLKDFYRMLWKPGLSVQTRELNQAQQFQQVQIERFADNIFKRGTIVDGCNFTFHNDYPYIKILDSDIAGLTIDPTLLVGLKLVNEANLQAIVVNSVDGFEATPPDLKTLFLGYTNSGNTANLTNFSAGDTLTAYDSKNAVFSVNVVSGASGFSNNDTVVVTPAILVVVSSGTIANGDYINQPSTGANVQVLTADYTTYLTSNQVLLTLKPRTVDLANASTNSLSWTVNALDSISNAANTLAAFVVEQLGTGLEASVITNGIGKVTEIPVLSRGSNYLVSPTITIRSVNNASGLASLNLVAQNYYSQFKVASVTASAGSGYAFTVDDGIIYQNGYMLRVSGQTIIVDKYSQSPNNVVVGFTTVETIVTANEDDSLFDNAIGTKNYTAPGADRLKLTPKLTLLSSELARNNTDFNVLVEWSEGFPFRQNKDTDYSRLGDEMAQHIFDQSGNFVVDTFQVATTSTANDELESKLYTVVVDPGQAYISGYKVQTLSNYYIDVDKGLDTSTANNTVSLNLGNYIRLNQVGGIFQFSTGDLVDLYNSPKRFLSNNSLVTTANVAPVGTKIGTARARSMVVENGIPGDPSTVYRLYLFNIKMNSGKNFSNVQSISYTGSHANGIGDIILTATNAGNVAVLSNTDTNGLIFEAGVESVKSTANSIYLYRTIDQTTNFGNNGILTKSIASNPNEFFPYSGNLSTSQMRELYVVPIANTIYQYANIEGTVSGNTTTANVDGSGTDFFSALEIGDYVNIFANATANTIKKVVQVVNSTRIVVDSNLAFTNSSCNFKRAFPQYVPIPFGTRAGLTANVDANNNVLKLTMSHANGTTLTIQGTTSINTAIGVNVKRTNVAATSKTANRNQLIKICLANNEGGTVGPWCLGVPDVLRLRGVYVGNSSVNTSSTNITASFYVDTNQNDDYLDLSYLMVNPRRQTTLSGSDYLLVQFDYLTRADDGYFDTVSYLGTSNSEQIAVIDATLFANLDSAVSTYEIPEVYTDSGIYHDLLKSIDFRPAAANTVAPTSNSETAPLNPNSTLSFGNTADPSNDKKFPLPDSAMTTSMTQYLGRIDSVFIAGDTGAIYVLKGTPSPDPRKRFPANHPKETLLLQTISVPAYPNITTNISKNVSDLIATGIANERYAGKRWMAHMTTPMLSSYDFQLSQPMVYTNEDVANLERRIKDLEYYQSLSILETSITNKIIPSSIDGTLNRFKFGFFADDYSTTNYSDMTNPQYAASFETEGTQAWGISKSPLTTDQNWATSDDVDANNPLLSPTGLVQKATNRITPPKLLWSVNHVLENLAYIDEVIISQDYATNSSSNAECTPKTVTVNVAASNGYYYASRNTLTSPNAPGFLPAQLTFGAKSGTATLYFDNGPNFTRFDVYQGNTLIASTNSSANIVTVLTEADKAYLQSTGNKTGFSLATPVTNFSRNGDLVNYVGKLQFIHDSSVGKSYTVTSNSTGTSSWEFLVEYPLTNPAVVETTVDPCVITNIVTNLTAAPVIIPYVGTIVISNAFDGWSCSKSFAINHIAVGEISFACTGLKPSTQHKFFLDGIDYSAWCETVPWNVGVTIRPKGDNPHGADGNVFDILTPLLGNVGKPLVTDASGKMFVVFYLPQSYKAASVPASVIQDNPKTPGLVTAGTKISGIAAIDAIYAARNQTSWGSSGYSTVTVSGPNSIATKLIAQRLPTSSIPSTPYGAV